MSPFAQISQTFLYKYCTFVDQYRWAIFETENTIEHAGQTVDFCTNRFQEMKQGGEPVYFCIACHTCWGSLCCKDSFELSWNILVHPGMRQIFVKARGLNCNLYLGLCHKDFVEIFLK